MFGHFLIIMLISTIVFALRLNFDTEVVGDALNWVLRMVPTYNLASSIYFDAAGDLLAQFRAATNGTAEDINPDIWYIDNIAGDLTSLAVHLFFWSCVLIIKERGYLMAVASCLRRFKKEVPVQDMKLDDDVVAEQERIVGEGLQ
jgi:hypothetical protein